MEEAVAVALATERTIDITTTGRRTGRPVRIEMWFHNVDGDIFLTGLPGERDWHANLLANPRFTFHLKQSVTADLEAVAVPIVEYGERFPILREITARLGELRRLDDWMARSPLLRVDFV